MKTKIIILMVGFYFWCFFGCAAPKIIGSPIKPETLKDGVYTGEAQQGPVSVIAEVTIENQRIAKIDLLKHRNWKGKDGEQVIVRIIEKQSTRVDAVSGATTSSVAIMNAVENAVQKASAKGK